MFGLSFWVIPLFSGCCWLGGLLSMLCIWFAKGQPHYAFVEPTQQILYISDVGASSWAQPIFISTSTAMVITFDIVFISERWLRHTGRLVPNYSKAEKVASVLSIIMSLVGAAGLILLTIFNTRDYHNVHESMLGVFIGGYVLSAICVCLEYLLLGLMYRKRDHESGLQTHEQHRILIGSFCIKALFIIMELGLAIAFGITEYKGHYNKSAILEWILALVYILYVWSYILDFLPATKSWHRGKHGIFPPVKRGSEDMEMEVESDGNQVGGPVYTR